MGVKICLHSTTLHRISSWRELRCNLYFLTSVRYIQSCLKGCSRLASRIFLITRTLLGGLFHVNRWLAGSWMCLGDKKPQTSPHFGVPPFWAGKNASSSTEGTQPPTAGRGGSNSHCNDVSVLHYPELIILLPGPVNDLCQQGPEQKHHKNSQINFWLTPQCWFPLGLVLTQRRNTQLEDLKKPQHNFFPSNTRSPAA